MDTNERRIRAAGEAADWWARLQSEDATRSEREQFVDWLRESAVHVAEMLRVAQVHGALEQFEQWARVVTEGTTTDAEIIELPGALTPAGTAGAVRRISRRTWIGALAAAIGAVAVGVSLLVPHLFGQTIQTERGERREVALTDGSLVQVGPDTLLRLEFDEQTRRVRLERGRALFRVAKSSTRPFLVHAGDATVRAVGTSFGVEHQDQSVIVTVAEGRVAVLAQVPGAEALRGVPATPPSEFSGGATPSIAQADEVFLGAGQQLTIQQSRPLEPVKRVDSARELAWAQGRLIFENDDVAAVIAEFNRYNQVQLRVSDVALAQRPISGVFDASDPESFIAFLQTVAPVRVIRSRDKEIVIAPGDAH